MSEQKVFVTSIEGNSQYLDGGSMFGNAPRALWERWYTPDSKGRIQLSCRAMLLEIGEKKVLCENGIGDYMEPKMAERFGVESGGHRLLQSLKKHGIDHRDIDYVILSHLHFDHAGGLLPSRADLEGANYELLFPNAQYVVGQEAFDRSKTPHFRDRASFIKGLSQKLEESERLIILKPQDTVPGFEGVLDFFISSGHTPGQLLTIVKGEIETFMFCGDLIPGTPWVNLPITMGYDRFPELLIDEKSLVYKSAVPQEWQMFYTHDPVVTCSRVIKNEKNKFEASEPLSSIVRREI